MYMHYLLFHLPYLITEYIRQDSVSAQGASGRKRAPEEQSSRPSKRSRSVSSYSSESDSVSTISTNRSPSRSPPTRRYQGDDEQRKFENDDVRGNRYRDRKDAHRRSSRSRSRSPALDSRNARARRSLSQSRSRSPYRDHRKERKQDVIERSIKGSNHEARQSGRDRSLSPYSRRLALTRESKGDSR